MTRMLGNFAALAVIGLGSAGHAEGADQVFGCVTLTHCDQAGACVQGDGDVVFTLSPKDVDAHGVGRYQIAYDAINAQAQKLSDIGPIFWSEGADDRQPLLVSGADTLLWHRLTLSDPPVSTTHFLSCVVTS